MVNVTFVEKFNKFIDMCSFPNCGWNGQPVDTSFYVNRFVKPFFFFFNKLSEDMKHF